MKKTLLLLPFVFLFLMQSCKQYEVMIHTQPTDVLIKEKNKVVDTSGLKFSVQFYDKTFSRTYTAMKRGYYMDSVKVTRDSSLDIRFSLKRIKGVSAEVTAPLKLTNDNALLLPVNVDVILHKGVGALSKYVKSEELSQKVYKALNSELLKMQSDSTIDYLVFPKDLQSKWTITAKQLEVYLKSLQHNLFNYYPTPPSVNEIIRQNKSVFDFIQETNNGNNPKKYLVFGYCRSVKATTGHVIGNIAVSGVAMAHQFGPTGYVYDASVFNNDRSTLFTAYVINPATGEVVDVRQQIASYHIVKKKELVQAFAKRIINFPNAVMRKNN